MSITDELRESVKQTCWAMTSKAKWFAIADRIDAEHESKISRAAQLLADAEKDRDFNYANWQDCKQKVLQHNITIDELNAEIERLKDELAHCIELPKDADGEYIHIGDEMEWVCPPHEPFDVIGIGRNGTLFYCTDECASSALWTTAGNKRHHHKQTVEDVLREFGDKYCDMVTGSDKESELFAEYTAKLQLKEPSQ